MPIPVAEVKKFKVSTLGDKKIQLPDYLVKPRIVGFLNSNKEKAYSEDELYQVLYPTANSQYPEPPTPLIDPRAREMYEFGIRMARRTFFGVKLTELFEEGEIVAGEVSGENYYYLEQSTNSLKP